MAFIVGRAVTNDQSGPHPVPLDSVGMRERISRRRLHTACACTAAFGLIVCGIAGCGSLTSPITVKVSIVGNPLGNPDALYKPARITVHVGQTVQWTDKDDLEHTVTPTDGGAGWIGGSPILHQGETYRHTFTKAGVYQYQCMIHANMLGTVTVEPK